ncbi:MAG: hypothetical protein ACKVZ0_13500 [Gemmatimonadales bacterium]
MRPTTPVGYHLRTLGRIGLEGPAGDVAVTDPMALLVLCRVALAGQSVPASELESWFFPGESPGLASTSLAAALATLPQLPTGPLIVRHGDQLSIAAGKLTIDVALDDHLRPLGSRERGQFLAGAPPVSPAFSDWVAAVRPRIRRPSDAPPRRLDQTTWGVIAVGGVALIAAIYATGARPPAGFAAGDRVGFAAIEAAAADTALAAALTTAAVVGLSQSPIFALHGARPAMAATTLDPLPADAATEVARRDTVRFVVRIRLDRHPNGYRLASTVEDVADGRSITLPTAHPRSAAESIQALDRVVHSVRRAFGERRTERAARSIPLPEATTASVEALRQFAAGEAAWAAGDLTTALTRWRAAVGLDPDFALAMIRLGQAGAGAEPDQVTALIDAALRHPDRLTWRARLEAEATRGRAAPAR